MNIYDIKENELFKIDCTDENGNKRDYNGIYKICSKYSTSFYNESSIKHITMIPVKNYRKSIVKYTIDNELFKKWNGCKITSGIDNIAIVFNIKEEDCEITNAIEDIKNTLNSLTKNTIIKIQYYQELMGNMYTNFEKDRDLFLKYWIRGYYQFNCKNSEDAGDSYIFTPIEYNTIQYFENIDTDTSLYADMDSSTNTRYIKPFSSRKKKIIDEPIFVDLSDKELLKDITICHMFKDGIESVLSINFPKE